MDRRPWQATVHGVAKSQTWLSDWTELSWLPFGVLLLPPQGVGDGQGSLVCCRPWSCKSWTRLSDWTALIAILHIEKVRHKDDENMPELIHAALVVKLGHTPRFTWCRISIIWLVLSYQRECLMFTSALSSARHQPNIFKNKDSGSHCLHSLMYL